MKEFAYQEQALVSLEEARRGNHYTCPECHAPLGVKKGLYKKAHFYHLYKSQCDREKNRQDHEEVQKRIKELCPAVELEKPFPLVRRIADIYWPDMDLVIEVQCSPISEHELAARNRDYNSLGLKVIWIFHTKRYGKKKLTPAEKEARKNPTYYTDINSRGNGDIYDFALQIQSRWRKIGRNKIVELNHPHFVGESTPIGNSPRIVEARLKFGLFFKGDLLYHYLKKDLALPMRLERAKQTWREKKFDEFLDWLAK